jgi:hypothetical protein
VSANHTRSGYHPYDAFDDETDDDDSTLSRWWSSADVFSGNVYNGSTSDHCGTFQGAYLKLELPYKLICSHVNLWLRDYNDGSTPNPQSPKNFKIVGSNDDINWVELKDEVNFVDTGNVSHPVIVNATKGYKYLAIVVTRVNNSTLVSIMDVEYYGHKENDTTRFPVSSTVLKYPHVAMTGPAQRGYVVEGSSRINYTDVEYEPWKSFGWSTPGTQSPYDAGWVSLNTSYSTSSPYNANSNESLSGIDGVGSRNGAYLTVTFPRKLAITKFDIYSRSATTDARVTEGYIYGSQDKTTWYEIAQISVDSTNLASYTNTTPCVITTDSTTAYRYAAIQATSVGNSAGYISYGKIELYGTEPEDVIARVGEGLDGKVANFRVYDKYLHEEQALELWDAQKDQFGRAESSVVVHKGRLGVGTTEPEGRFAVLDEAGEMGEFPPKPMTDYETYMEGHGVFKASASEYTGAAVHAPWNAFSHGVAEFWLMGQNAGYNLVSGEYEDNEFRLSSETSMGQWIKLEMPYLTNVKNFILKPRTVGAEYQAPKSGELWGSKDNDTWTKLHTFTDIQYHVGHTRFNFENSEFYKYYALVVTKVVGGHSSNDYIGIVDLRFFGTRERGQSTLHDGSLTLTKNLTVPRIGPPLDADDTPRRDRLVVEYNTSTNPTENGTVKDTSGRGNDGLFYGGASYDATEKALVFDGASDTIRGTQNIGTGEQVLSMSMWIKRTAAVNTFDYVCTIGDSTTASMAGVLINVDKFVFARYGSDIYSSKTITNNQWYHVVGVYRGGDWGTTSVDLYVDGTKETTTHSVSSQGPLNLTSNKITFGDNSLYTGSSDFNGSISQFKLYDTALTADEVKRLYDMGRIGSVANPQPLHIAAPLYAPGTICQVGIVHFPRDNISISTGQTKTLTTFNFKPKFANSRLFFTLTIYCQAGNLYWNIWVYRNDSDRITSHSTGNYGITGQNYTGVGGGHQVRVGQGYDDPNTTESQKYSVKFVNDNQATAVTLGVAGPHLLKIEEICQ